MSWWIVRCNFLQKGISSFLMFLLLLVMIFSCFITRVQCKQNHYQNFQYDEDDFTFDGGKSDIAIPEHPVPSGNVLSTQANHMVGFPYKNSPMTDHVANRVIRSPDKDKIDRDLFPVDDVGSGSGEGDDEDDEDFSRRSNKHERQEEPTDIKTKEYSIFEKQYYNVTLTIGYSWSPALETTSSSSYIEYQSKLETAIKQLMSFNVDRINVLKFTNLNDSAFVSCEFELQAFDTTEIQVKKEFVTRLAYGRIGQIRVSNEGFSVIQIEDLFTEFYCINGTCTGNRIRCDKEENRCLTHSSGGRACTTDTVKMEVPLVKLENSSATINPRENVKLICNVSSYPTPQIFWTWDNRPLSNLMSSFNYTFSDSNSILSVQFKTDKIKGRFVCIVYSKMGNTTSFTDIILADFLKPVFSKGTNLENSVKYFKNTEPLQLSCCADGDPKPSISWSWVSDDNFFSSLYENPSSRPSSFAFSLSNNNHSLLITNISTATKVRFTCTAENLEGYIEKYADVSEDYIQLESDSDSDSGSTQIFIILGIVLGIVCVLLILSFLVWYKFKPQKANNLPTGVSLKVYHEGGTENINMDSNLQIERT